MCATKHDLLAFQALHFGDDAHPETWFVDSEDALAYDPAEEDDGLGWYEDGVKRTLTDEQIEMFRHTEMEQLRRREENEVEGSDEMRRDAADELEDVRLPEQKNKPVKVRRSASQEDRNSTPSSDTAKRKREQEVPYDERHKRKWEDYIEENDPLHGSMTHRRIVRELDTQVNQSIELDY